MQVGSFHPMGDTPLPHSAILSMLFGMRTTERVTVTLPTALAAVARQAVAEGRAESMSAYVTAAVEQAAARERDDRLYSERWANHGAPTIDHAVWALKALGLPATREDAQRWVGEATDLASLHSERVSAA